MPWRKLIILEPSYKDMRLIMHKLLLSLILTVFLFGCTEVGSEAWCKDMKQKDKGDWTANETADFAKHCIF